MAQLRVWIGHQRFIRNAKTRERDRIRAEGGVLEDNQAYSHLITDETAFLSDVPSQILRNGAVRFYTGLQRFRAGLGGAPKIKSRHGRQSVLVTSELFRFLPLPFADRSDRHGWVIELGTKANPIGRLPFRAHRAWQMPRQLVISVEPNGKWFVSFSYEGQALEHPRLGRPAPAEPEIERSADELLYEVQGLLDLERKVWAGDRGVAVPLMGCDGKAWDFSDVQKKRMQRAETRRRRYQRRMARSSKVKGADGKMRASKGYLKLIERAARQTAYCADVREDFAHKTSHALVNCEARVFAFEDLQIKNMTAAPQPKQDAAGRWARNGSAAKAGLNAAILRSAWGSVLRFTTYKAKRCNKLVYALPPAFTSQMCAECGCCDSDNRKNQATFHCVGCGHKANADVNAAQVLQWLAIDSILAGELPDSETHKKKRVAFARKREKALELEQLEVTSVSGDRQSAGEAQASNDAELRISA